MPIWDGAAAVRYERSSSGQTAAVLGADDAALASCDDAGTVTDAGGTHLMTATFTMPSGAKAGDSRAGLKRLQSRLDVTDAGGAPVGAVTIRKYSFGPFKKRLELVLVGADGAELGELVTTEKKAREFAVSCGGTVVANLALADRDRGIARTVERWTLTPGSRPPGPADRLAAAAVLRFGKLLAEVAAPG